MIKSTQPNAHRTATEVPRNLGHPHQQQHYLGGGHFGKVWLEQDTGLKRLCAAKYLDASLLAPGAEAFAEAQTMVEAEHDHVVLIYSAALEGGEPVIRMEYLPDGSVEHKYAGAPAPILEAIRIMEDACRGIEHLHVRGILHRDIKLGNLLLTPTGSVKVSDFGLSCPIADASGAPQIAYQPHRPPEAVSQGTGITTRAGDIYAAGVTAYRLLNGNEALTRFVAAGTDPLQLIVKGRFPDRSYWLPHIHDRLRKVVNKAMHVDPNRRYADAKKFRRALEVLVFRNRNATTAQGTVERGFLFPCGHATGTAAAAVCLRGRSSSATGGA